MTSIYREYEWDNAEVVVWDPKRQKRMRLIFVGSSRPDGEKPGEINFIVDDYDNNK